MPGRMKRKGLTSIGALCTALVSITPSGQAAAQQEPLTPVTIDSPKPHAQKTVQATRTGATRARRTTNRDVRRRGNPVVAAQPVTITPAQLPVFTGLQNEGLASQGYRSTTATDVGPFANLALQDTPYSVNIVPREQIENTISTSTDQIFRANPFTQVTLPELRNGSTYVNMRGFTVTNTLTDGLKGAGYGNFSGVIPVENLERVEVFTGLTGFLFGQADPGGTINYVLKRPTAQTYGALTMGDVGGQSGYGALDVGGPIDKEGRFGFRLNIAGQDGQTPVTYQREQRNLYSIALDWHITNDALVQVDYSHSYLNERGVPTSFNSGVFGNNYYPAAPQADVLWSQPWTSISDLTDTGGIRLNWNINNAFTFRTAFSITRNQMDGGINTAVVNNYGGFIPFDGVFGTDVQNTKSEYAYLDAKFDTGPIAHKLTVGFNGTYYDDSNSPYEQQDCAYPVNSQGLFNCAGLNGSPSPFFISATPLYFPAPANPYNNVGGPLYKDTSGANNNIVLGDVITFTKGLDLIVGVTRSEIIAKNFNNDGTVSGKYDTAAYTPSASLVFKPVDWITTYATYIQGLEQGAIVGPGYTNSGTTLPAAIDEQYEVGTKITAGNVLWTAALFKINKINQYSNNATPEPTYVQDGREIHQGVELSATGKLTDNLSVVAGFTAFDARVEQSNTPALDGLRPVNVSNLLTKGYFEYRLPFFHSIILTGGVNFQSNFAVNTTNTWRDPAVTTLDLGARYETTINSHPFIFRVYATNVTNLSYWQANGQLGDPRRVAFTGTVKF